MANDNQAKIVLDGDISPFRQKLREAATDLRRFGDDGSSAFERMAGPLGTLQSRFTAIAGVISGLAFGSGIKSALDQADALNEMSERTGIAVETLARLKFAGEQTGASIDAISDAVKKLGKLMIEAGSGDDAANRKLAAFGVTAEQIKRSDVEGALRNIAERLKELPEAARQGALEHLAKGFGSLVPLLKDGSDGLQQLLDKADQLGATSGYKAAASGADELNDAIGRTGAIMTGVTQRISAEFLPRLSDAVGGLGQLALSAESNKEELTTLGIVVIGGVLTNSLRGMVTHLQQASVGWIGNVQATRQATATQIAAAQATVNSTAAVKAHAAMLVAEAEAAVVSAGGMARLAAVQNILIPARRDLAIATQSATRAEQALVAAKADAAAKTNAVNLAMNALGGPLGLVVALIGAGATAWTAFGQNGLSAVRSINEEIGRGREVLARYKREQQYGTGDEGQLRAAMEAVESRISVLVQSSGSSAGAAAELEKLRTDAEQLQAALDDLEGRKGQGQPAAPNSSLQDFLRSLKTPEKAKAEADPSYMQFYEAALAERKRLASEEDALREYTKAEELAYWQLLLQYADLSTKDRVAIEKKASDLTVAVRREEAKEKQALDAETAGHAEAMALLRIDAEAAAAEAALAAGQMNALQRAEIEIQFEQRRLEIQRAALQARLQLAEQDPNASPAERARVQHQIEVLQAQHGIKLRGLQSKVAEEQGRIWGDLTSRMSGLWDKGIQAMMNGTFRWRNAFRAIGSELVGWFANSVVGNFVKEWLAGKAKQLAISMGFLSAEKTAQVAGSAATMATKGTEATVVSSANAVEAGSGAAAAMASIPFVGPMLALAAMASVFAAVSGLGKSVKSASRGYDIPRGVNPMVQTHEEEMILPSQYANVIRGLAEGGQGGGQATGGGDQHHYHINAIDARSFERFARDNKRALAGAIKDAARDGFK